MIVDLYDAIDRMLWAIVAWIAIGAALATPVVLLAAWAVSRAVKRAWRAVRGALGSRKRLKGPLAPELPSGDSSPGKPAERRSAPRTPAWANTQPHDYEDAA